MELTTHRQRPRGQAQVGPDQGPLARHERDRAAPFGLVQAVAVPRPAVEQVVNALGDRLRSPRSPPAPPSGYRCRRRAGSRAGSAAFRRRHRPARSSSRATAAGRRTSRPPVPTGARSGGTAGGRARPRTVQGPAPGRQRPSPHAAFNVGRAENGCLPQGTPPPQPARRRTDHHPGGHPTRSTAAAQSATSPLLDVRGSFGSPSRSGVGALLRRTRGGRCITRTGVPNVLLGRGLARSASDSQALAA
jgi:hypothetical protein